MQKPFRQANVPIYIVFQGLVSTKSRSSSIIRRKDSKKYSSLFHNLGPPDEYWGRKLPFILTLSVIVTNANADTGCWF